MDLLNGFKELLEPPANDRDGLLDGFKSLLEEPTKPQAPQWGGPEERFQVLAGVQPGAEALTRPLDARTGQERARDEAREKAETEWKQKARARQDHILSTVDNILFEPTAIWVDRKQPSGETKQRAVGSGKVFRDDADRDKELLKRFRDVYPDDKMLTDEQILTAGANYRDAMRDAAAVANAVEGREITKPAADALTKRLAQRYDTPERKQELLRAVDRYTKKYGRGKSSMGPEESLAGRVAGLPLWGMVDAAQSFYSATQPDSPEMAFWSELKAQYRQGQPTVPKELPWLARQAAAGWEMMGTAAPMIGAGAMAGAGAAAMTTSKVKQYLGGLAGITAGTAPLEFGGNIDQMRANGISIGSRERWIAAGTAMTQGALEGLVLNPLAVKGGIGKFFTQWVEEFAVEEGGQAALGATGTNVAAAIQGKPIPYSAGNVAVEGLEAARQSAVPMLFMMGFPKAVSSANEWLHKEKSDLPPKHFWDVDLLKVLKMADKKAPSRTEATDAGLPEGTSTEQRAEYAKRVRKGTVEEVERLLKDAEGAQQSQEAPAGATTAQREEPPFVPILEPEPTPGATTAQPADPFGMLAEALAEQPAAEAPRAEQAAQKPSVAPKSPPPVETPPAKPQKPVGAGTKVLRELAKKQAQPKAPLGAHVRKKRKPSELKKPKPTAAVEEPVDIKRKVYDAALRVGQEWGGGKARGHISDLRKEMSDLSKEQQDEVLRALEKEESMIFWPLDNPLEGGPKKNPEVRAGQFENSVGIKRGIYVTETPPKPAPAKAAAKPKKQPKRTAKTIKEEKGLTEPVLAEREAILEEAWNEWERLHDFEYRGQRGRFTGRLAELDRDLEHQGVDTSQLPSLDDFLQTRVMKRELRRVAEQKRGTEVDAIVQEKSTPQQAAKPKKQPEGVTAAAAETYRDISDSIGKMLTGAEETSYADIRRFGEWLGKQPAKEVAAVFEAVGFSPPLKSNSRKKNVAELMTRLSEQLESMERTREGRPKKFRPRTTPYAFETPKKQPAKPKAEGKKEAKAEPDSLAELTRRVLSGESGVLTQKLIDVLHRLKQGHTLTNSEIGALLQLDKGGRLGAEYAHELARAMGFDRNANGTRVLKAARGEVPLEGMSYKNLKALAKQMGATTQEARTKAGARKFIEDKQAAIAERYSIEQPAKQPTKLQQASKKAHEEVGEAFDKLGKALGEGGLGANPFANPKIVLACADATAKLAKAGVIDFAVAMEKLAQRFGEAQAKILEPVFRQEWDKYWAKQEKIKKAPPKPAPPRELPEKKAEKPKGEAAEDQDTAIDTRIDDWLADRQDSEQEADSRAARHQDELKQILGKRSVVETLGEAFKGTSHQRVMAMDAAMHLYIDLKDAEQQGFGTPSEQMAKYEDKLNDKQKRLFARSQSLPPAVRTLADKIIQENKSLGEEALDAEVLKNVRDSYSARLWKQEQGEIPADAVGKFRTTTARAKARTLESILHGWSLGKELQITGAIGAQQIASKQVSQAVHDRRMIGAAVSEGLLSDKKEDSDWQIVEHPNFKHWKWTGKAEEGEVYGKGIFINEDGDILQEVPLYAPKYAAKALNNILGNSKLPGTGVITKWNAIFKHMLLSLSLFHHQAFLRSYIFGTHGIQGFRPLKAYREGKRAILNYEGMTRELVRAGLTIGTVQDFDERLVKEKTKIGEVIDKVPVAAEVKNALIALRDQQINFLFRKLGSRLKVMGALHEFQRLLTTHKKALESGTITREEVARIAAEMLNDDFGGLNLQRMRRNPTGQHIFRLLALAPDWTESNVRSMVKAFKRGEEGHAYRRMWARVLARAGAATILAQLLMAFMDDDEDFWSLYQRQWKEGNLRWLDVDVTPIARALGFKIEEDTRKYFSIVGHFRDPIKFVAHPVKSAKHKSSVLGSFVLEALTGTDWAGRGYTTASEILGIDDKGTYKTSGKRSDGSTYKQGDPKGGQLAGKTVSWGNRGALEYSQMPSFLISQGKGVLPIQLQNLIGFLAGEMDGFDAVTKSAGLMTATTYPDKEGPKKSKKDSANTKKLRRLGML